MASTASSSGLTVVIPVWDDYVRLLPEAVASIRRSRTPAEILVVENASRAPLGVLEGCEIISSDIRLSKGACRNLGLTHVRSEWVVFLDADDLLLPGALDLLLDAARSRSGIEAVVGRILTPQGRIFRVPRRFCSPLARFPRLLAWINAVWPVVLIQGCAVLRSEAVRAAGAYPDDSLSEDWVLATALAFLGAIGFIPEPVLMYRMHLASPGEAATPRLALLRGARLVRDRLHANCRTSPLARGCLAMAQLTVTLILSPLARAARRLR
jgi:glycosyltransferase involved in cell wall biosynthesis